MTTHSALPPPRRPFADPPEAERALPGWWILPFAAIGTGVWGSLAMLVL